MKEDRSIHLRSGCKRHIVCGTVRGVQVRYKLARVLHRAHAVVTRAATPNTKTDTDTGTFERCLIEEWMTD